MSWTERAREAFSAKLASHLNLKAWHDSAHGEKCECGMSKRLDDEQYRLIEIDLYQATRGARGKPHCPVCLELHLDGFNLDNNDLCDECYQQQLIDDDDAAYERARDLDEQRRVDEALERRAGID